jgi:hypothetical protein
MSDVNIDHIEALVGPLPRRREWERWCEYTQPLSLPERGKADAALAEAYEKIQELDDKLMEAEGAHDAARRWFEEQKKQFARAEKAEADLAAIESLLDEVEQREARRCGACALWQEWKPGSWDCAEEWCGYSTNPETFGCTHWEQRREG